jgi:lysophospholipase L1-like esterase
MKMNKLYNILLLLLSMAFFSCEDNLLDGVTSLPADPPIVPATAGSADFSNYISLGNSLTAGYMDGALYNRGQSFSFPAQMHSAMAQITGSGTPTGGFNQPDISSENGFFGTAGAGTVILGRLKLNASSLPAPIIPGELPGPYTGEKAALNNFGVPGILLGQLLSSDTGNPNSPLFNPLYARFATQPGVSTILGDALATQPTFFSLWIGNNDVLGYAVSGATREEVFTDPATFEFLYGQAFGALVSSGAKGVVGNIPNVTDIPFFKTVPWNALPLDAATAAGATAAFTDYNGGLAAALANSIITQAEHDLRVINFVEGANGFLVEDPELTDVATLSGGQIPIPKYRQTNATDLVTLTAASILGTRVNPEDPATTRGVGVPLENKDFLTTAEIAEIAQRTSELNTIIANQVITLGGENVELVDMNTIFSDFASNGVSRYYGVTLDPTLAPPFGAFSLDGVHPNARGYAFVANVFIDAINAKFGSTLPYVSMEAAPGNDFPPAQ